jgi:RimJ/RimL family protein N-acetyltransferase
MIQIKLEESMHIRHSNKNDIPQIMQIINQAQESFKLAGINQWQNNYPNETSIQKDIELGESYVVLINANIIGTFALSFRIESTYDTIYDGKWLSNEEYAVIHRIAIANDYKGKGVSTLVFREVEKWCLEKNIHSIKIDTHHDNQSMRKLLEKNGFSYCGIIYLLDGNMRLAYEKVL